MIAAMDEAVGDILQHLSKQRMLEDTILIFTSDVIKLRKHIFEKQE